jgi:hypothetical protein
MLKSQQGLKVVHGTLYEVPLVFQPTASRDTKVGNHSLTIFAVCRRSLSIGVPSENGPYQPFLRIAVGAVFKNYQVVIAEHGLRFFEAHMVLRLIGGILGLVPLKNQST